MIPYDALYELAEREIEKRRQSVVDDLAKGGAPDYAAYCRQVGTIRGLNDALVALDEAKAKINMDEES